MPNGPRNLSGVTESVLFQNAVVTESKVIGNGSAGSSTALLSSQAPEMTTQEAAMYGMVGMGVAMLVAGIFIIIIAYAVRSMRRREQMRSRYISDLYIAQANSQTSLTSKGRPSKSVQKWFRQVSRKKSHPQIYTIPIEIREQLKQIYVY